MKITTSAELVDKALKEIKTLTIDEAHSKMTEGKSNIIAVSYTHLTLPTTMLV